MKEHQHQRSHDPIYGKFVAFRTTSTIWSVEICQLYAQTWVMAPSPKNFSPFKLGSMELSIINCQYKWGELCQKNHMRERGAQGIYDHSHC